MSFQEGGCFVRWSEEEGGQKRKPICNARSDSRTSLHFSHQLWRPSFAIAFEKIRSFKEFMSRMFSGTFGSIRSLHLKRAGSDLLFTCLPRYGCAERVMEIGSTVPGRTAVCVIGRLRWTKKYSCRPRYTPREGVGSATRPSARRIAGPSPFLRQGVT